MGAKTTFIVTGDSFITRRIPEHGYEGFEKLQRIISSHDVRFNNLEITIHDQKGYPAAFSGGTWAMTSPEMLDDLRRFGFNLYNTANNHSGDYGHGGLLATIRHLKERSMLFAGTGKHLAAASAPTYLETAGARVAMIGVCSTFHPSDMAGPQSTDLPGRPGLNPLRFKRVFSVQKNYYDTLIEIAEKTNINADYLLSVQNGYAMPLPNDELNFGGIRFKLDKTNTQHTLPNAKDIERILANIREAKRQADYVLVSIHSHEFNGNSITAPAEFIRTFCHSCIDAGADAILGHGPHEIRGIELYKGKVIFYSLGNFIFQTETVLTQPAEAYENAGLPVSTTVGEYMDHRSHHGTSGYAVQPNIWQSVMASFSAENGCICSIQLYPITLHMDHPRSQIGFPSLTDNCDVLHRLAKLSEPFGTEMDIRNGIATISL